MKGTMKKTIRKVLSVVLALAMVITSITYTPSTVDAADYSLTYGNTTYTVGDAPGNSYAFERNNASDTGVNFAWNSAANMFGATNATVTIKKGSETVSTIGTKKSGDELTLTELVAAKLTAGKYTIVYTSTASADKVVETPLTVATSSTETTSGGATEGITLQALKDAYVYNFVESNGGFKVVFKDPNSVTISDGSAATYTYTLNIGDKKIENIKASGDTVDLRGLGLTEGTVYSVTMNAVYTDGEQKVESPASATTKFTYKTTQTTAHDNKIAKVFFTTSGNDKVDVNSLYNGNKDNKPKVPVAITVQEANGKVNVANYGTANIRGNSTANAAKKPYNFKLNESADVLSMGSAKKWSLLANCFDKTLIRNQIGMDFQRDLESTQVVFPDSTISKTFTSNCQPVDLYIDGNYAGTYLLVESVEVGTSRVDIDTKYTVDGTDNIAEGKTPKSVSINGTEYAVYDTLLEVANDCKDKDANRWDEEAYYFQTTSEGDKTPDYFAINEPARTNTTYGYLPTEANKPEFVNKTQTFVNGFETALANNNYELFSQFIDVESFVDFYITAELFMTKDIAFSSTRFYIKDGKMYAGPLWDLDLSSGNNIENSTAESFWAQNFSWFRLLMANETFSTKVKTRYKELQSKITGLYATNGEVDQAYNTIRASAKTNYENAYTNNTSLGTGWKYTYVYGNSGFFDQKNDPKDTNTARNNFGVYGSLTVYDTYESYITDYKNWLEARNTWLLDQWKITEETPSETPTKTPSEESTTQTSDPVGDGWTRFTSSSTSDYYYLVPEEYKKDFNTGGTTDRGSDLYLVFGGKFETGVQSAKLNDTDCTIDNVGVSVPKTSIATNNTEYTLVVSNNSGDTATVYIKKYVAPTYKPTSLVATVNNAATRPTAHVTWTQSDDARNAGCTYTVQIGTLNAVPVDANITSADIDISSLSYGTHDVTVNAILKGEVVGTTAGTLSYKDPDAVVSTVTFDTSKWEYDRSEGIKWTKVENAVGYAIYVDGKLYQTINNPDTLSIDVPAYAFANSENTNRQKTTVGTHTTAIVALMNGDAVENALEKMNANQIMDRNSFPLYVNYVFGNQTDIWNNTGVDSVWNFTLCESADDPNITRGANVKVTYNKAGAADLVFNDMGEHAKGDQAWTVKAAIYNQPIKNGELQNLSFDIYGPSTLIGNKIMIHCFPEEWDRVNNEYGKAAYDDPNVPNSLYTFQATEDGKAVLHYSNSFPAISDTYDLVFGLGLLDFKESTDKSILLTDAVSKKVYGLTSLTPSPVVNKNDIDKSSIFVSWQTDVPSHLESEYTYKVYIDGKLATLPDGETAYKNNMTFSQYGEGKDIGSGEHTVKVESIYNGAITSTQEKKVTIESQEKPDLVVTDISIPDGEYHIGETVKVSVTVKNIGTADAENHGNLSIFPYVKGKRYNNTYMWVNDGNKRIHTLAAGESYTAKFNYVISKEDDKGGYLFDIGAEVDGDHNQAAFESDTTNNSFTKTFKFYEPISTPTITNAGDHVKIDWNDHDNTNKKFIVSYTVEGESVPRTIETVGNVSVIELPKDVWLESGSEVIVTSVHTDGSSHVYSVGTALPDLVISKVDIPKNAYAVGEVVPIKVTMKNVGVSTAIPTKGNKNLTIMPTKNGTILGENVTPRYRYMAEDGLRQKLDIGKEYSYTFNYTVQYSDKASENGIIQLGGMADADYNVIESNETNNISEQQIKIMDKGTLTLNGNASERINSATWTKANEDIVKGYKLKYTTDGTTYTEVPIITTGESANVKYDENTKTYTYIFPENVKLYNQSEVSVLVTFDEVSETAVYYDFASATVQIKEHSLMDWTPLTEENSPTIYNFKVAQGTKTAHVEFKVVDTNNKDLDYKDIVTKYIGYNGMYMSLGFNSKYKAIVVKQNDSSGKVISTVPYWAAITSDQVNSNIHGLDSCTIMDVEGWDIDGKDAVTGYPVQKTKVPGTHFDTVDNSFNMNIDDFDINSHYLLKLYNTDGTYVTLAFRVTDENGEMSEWTQAMGKNMDNNGIPFYYHDRSCETKGSFYYSKNDIKLSNIAAYNGNYISIDLDTQYKINANNHKIIITRGLLDNNGNMIKPLPDGTVDGAETGSYYSCTGDLENVNARDYYADANNYVAPEVYGINGNNKFQIMLPTLMKQIPIHSKLGGAKDNEYYYMKIYWDEEKNPGEYVSIPIKVAADIPQIENVYGLSVTNRGDALSVSWTNTTSQNAHGYLYDLYIDDELVKENVTAGSYNFTGYSTIGDTHTVKVVAKWCEQTAEKTTSYTVKQPETKPEETIPADTPTIPTDNKWVLINGQNTLPISIDGTIDSTTNAQIYYYTDVDMKSVVGYNDYYIALNGSDKYFTGTDTKIYVQREDSTTFTSKNVYDSYYKGQTLMNAAKMFSVPSDYTTGTTYKYVVRVTGNNGNTYKDFYFKVVPTESQGTVSGTGDWRLISGESELPVKMGTSSKLMGTVRFLDNPSITNTYDIVGYNGYYMSIIGSNTYYTGEATKISVSNASDTELSVDNLSGLTFTEKTIYDKVWPGQIIIKCEDTFTVEYAKTYYLLKVESGVNVTYIPVEITVKTGEVEVLGFQMNTNQNEGAVAEKSPSFRVVSKTSNVMTIKNKLYEVKKMGTVYAVADQIENLETQMNLDGVKANDYIAHVETTDRGKLTGYTTTESDTNYNTYFALTFIYKSYMYHTLEQNYAFRAYAVLDDGTVVYGHNIYTTNMYEIAQNLYDNQKMGTKKAHDFLYKNILNLVDMDKNRSSIANAMFRAMGVNSYSDERYTLVANMTVDIYNYARCRDGYTYQGREQFICKNNEAKLLEVLNKAQMEKGKATYTSVYDWIYYETSNYSNNSGVPYKGCYRLVEYGWDNTIDDDFHTE